MSDNSRFVFSFESDWLRGLREVSGPITWIRKEKSMQQSVNFINKFKITLMIITAIIHGDRLRQICTSAHADIIASLEEHFADRLIFLVSNYMTLVLEFVTVWGVSVMTKFYLE